MIKQTSSEAQWQELWDNATKRYSLSEIIALKERTEAIIANNYDNKTIVGYSGGKDSIVLRHMVEHCIDNPKFITCELQNEFPRFSEWLLSTAPKNMAIVYDDKLSLAFLNKNLSYLFPHDQKEKNAYVVTFRKPTYAYLKANGLNKFMTGKRFDDGNTCGKVNGSGMHYTYMTKDDMYTLNPMAKWTHDQLLAYIQYFDIELPEIYSYPNGFRFGTHPWTERRRLNMRYCDTFDEIMTLDESILKKAASQLEIADLYLKGKLNF